MRQAAPAAFPAAALADRLRHVVEHTFKWVAGVTLIKFPAGWHSSSEAPLARLGRGNRMLHCEVCARLKEIPHGLLMPAGCAGGHHAEVPLRQGQESWQGAHRRCGE